MPVITLPDGNQKIFEKPVTVAQLAESIGAGLAKAALAGRVDGALVDTSYELADNEQVSIITGKDAEGLEIIRHSAAHLLAHAVKDLFPKAQVTIGPVIEDGFYYDFAYQRPFTPEDLEAIEKHMHELAKQEFKVSRQVVARDEAIRLFQGMGEEYKVEIIEDLPEDEVVTIYQQGDFVDLCRGPHVPHTGHIKAFKLTKMSGAYWRGDSNNEMLQRIYGTAWPDKKALKAYLFAIEEAAKRDHRKLAKKMDLFHLQEEAPGMVFWHPNGWAIYQVMQTYLRERQQAFGYQEIHTPQLVDSSLWQKSGHWEKFGDEMFITESEHHTYAVKPMSCPCHIQIFNQGLKSYRDLPLRFAEFGNCHRSEPSGTLHGLLRVRNFVQDDGHIFCTKEQIADEAGHFIQQLLEVYRDFGFNDVLIKLSTRPEKRVGSDENWDQAEAGLEQVLNDSGLDWELQPGEGAFYGPKIEFSLRDCLGRVWQCGTLQLDFVMPERLGAQYVDEAGNRQTPVMLHRAVIGTFERFMGILLEEYGGNLPIWLAPVQVIIMNIADRHAEYATNIAKKLQKLGFRANLDLRNEKIGFKIREQSIQRVPYQLIVGDKEIENKTVTVRTQSGEDLGGLSFSELEERISAEIAQRGRR